MAFSQAQFGGTALQVNQGLHAAGGIISNVDVLSN